MGRGWHRRITDHHQRLCLSLALWNERDPILKERLFGLTNSEGNHGEDCKEPLLLSGRHPHSCLPENALQVSAAEISLRGACQANRSRRKEEPEYELLDTGVFDGDRYFDVFIEYGRINPSDVNMLITVHNRGPESATIHILPQLWFRNTWSWKSEHYDPRSPREIPNRSMSRTRKWANSNFLWMELTNGSSRKMKRIAAGSTICTTDGHFKDAFHEYVVQANSAAVNPAHTGTKTAAHISREVPAGSSFEARACLQAVSDGNPFEDFDEVMRTRRAEADAYFMELQKDIPIMTLASSNVRPWPE